MDWIIAKPMAKSFDPVQKRVKIPYCEAVSPGLTFAPFGRVRYATTPAKVNEHIFTSAQAPITRKSTEDKSSFATFRKIKSGRHIFPTIGPMPLLALGGMNPVSFPKYPRSIVKKMMDKELTRVASVSPPVVGGAVLLEDMLFIILQPLCSVYILYVLRIIIQNVTLLVPGTEKSSMSPRLRGELF